ncbi:kinesin-like nuclear fusion protein [Parahypoxylon ruwenzoriense]
MRTRLQIEIARLMWRNAKISSQLHQTCEGLQAKLREIQGTLGAETVRLKRENEANEEEKHNPLRDSRTEFGMTLDKINKEFNVLTERIEHIEQEKRSLETALEGSRLDFQSVRSELTTRNDELTILRQKLKEPEGVRLKEKADEFVALQRELEEARNEMDNQTATKRRLSESLAIREIEAESLRQELNNARRKLGDITASKETMGESLRVKEEEVRRLIQELGALREAERLHEEALKQRRKRAEHKEREFELKLRSIRETSENSLNILMNKLFIEESRRHSLFEQVQRLRGAIRVICRIRPVDGGELLEYKTERAEFHNHPANLRIREFEKTVYGELKLKWSVGYEFERIFLPEETNADVFGEIGHFVQSFIDGRKVCIFCYGQSGTGKTYTMSNRDDVKNRKEGIDYENDGIIPRVKTMIFREKARLNELGYDMQTKGCCYEIYNNELWLLKAGGNERKTMSRAERAVTNPQLVNFSSDRDFDAMVEVGMKNRHFGRTELNDNSSRSHFIISLETTVTLSSSSEVVREGLLNLVDLAGSERTLQAGTAGSAFQEGRNINTSLTALERVFVDLADGKNPTYNGNLLTELLQRSLSRDCMTLMFVMINPLRANWPATKHTLQFAATAQSAKRTEQRIRGPMRAASGSGNSRGQLPKGGN